MFLKSKHLEGTGRENRSSKSLVYFTTYWVAWDSPDTVSNTNKQTNKPTTANNLNVFLLTRYSLDSFDFIFISGLAGVLFHNIPEMTRIPNLAKGI